MKRKDWGTHTDFKLDGVGKIIIQTNVPGVHRNNLPRLAKVVAESVKNSPPPINKARTTMIQFRDTPLTSKESTDKKFDIGYYQVGDTNYVEIYSKAFKGDVFKIQAAGVIIDDTADMVRRAAK